jgi:hypothetical protein
VFDAWLGHGLKRSRRVLCTLDKRLRTVAYSRIQAVSSRKETFSWIDQSLLAAARNFRSHSDAIEAPYLSYPQPRDQGMMGRHICNPVRAAWSSQGPSTRVKTIHSHVQNICKLIFTLVTHWRTQWHLKYTQAMAGPTAWSGYASSQLSSVPRRY